MPSFTLSVLQRRVNGPEGQGDYIFYYNPLDFSRDLNNYIYVEPESGAIDSIDTFEFTGTEFYITYNNGQAKTVVVDQSDNSINFEFRGGIDDFNSSSRFFMATNPEGFKLFDRDNQNKRVDLTDTPLSETNYNAFDSNTIYLGLEDGGEIDVYNITDSNAANWTLEENLDFIFGTPNLINITTDNNYLISASETLQVYDTATWTEQLNQDVVNIQNDDDVSDNVEYYASVDSQNNPDIHLVDLNSMTYINRTIPADNTVSVSFETDNIVWVGTDNGTVYRHDIANNTFDLYEADFDSTLSQDEVTVSFRDIPAEPQSYTTQTQLVTKKGAEKLIDIIDPNTVYSGSLATHKVGTGSSSTTRRQTTSLANPVTSLNDKLSSTVDNSDSNNIKITSTATVDSTELTTLQDLSEIGLELSDNTLLQYQTFDNFTLENDQATEIELTTTITYTTDISENTSDFPNLKSILFNALKNETTEKIAEGNLIGADGTEVQIESLEERIPQEIDVRIYAYQDFLNFTEISELEIRTGSGTVIWATNFAENKQVNKDYIITVDINAK